MRIAFVNATRVWAGVKVWMLEFGAELVRQGHAVHLFARDARMVEQAAGLGLETVHLPHFGADYSPRRIAWFARAFRARGIEAAVLNIYKELRTAGIAARLLGIPVVHRVGLVGDIADAWDRRLAHRWLVSRVLVTCEALRRDLLAARPFIRPHEIVCVHNGRTVSGSASGTGGGARRAARHDPVRFVITARLEAHKGHRHLLEALRRLDARGLRGFTCDIFGEGALAGELTRAIPAAGLEGRVRLRGFAPRLADALADYDFGLLASDYESLANTVLEYLAAGLPVVATDVGGIPEMVEPGANGFLFPYGDVDALTDHLACCLRMDDAAYARLSAGALDTLRTRFDRADKARELADLLAGLAAAPPGPARRPAP